MADIGAARIAWLATGAGTPSKFIYFEFQQPPAEALPQPEGGGDRNAIPLYKFANSRVVHHFVTEMPLRVSALRALGAYMNIFSIESFMDELAQASGDPARDPAKDIEQYRLNIGIGEDNFKRSPHLFRFGYISTGLRSLSHGAQQSGVRTISRPCGCDIVAADAYAAKLLAGSPPFTKKELEKAETEIAKVEQKLNNPQFVQKVPAAVLEEHRKRLLEWQTKRDRAKAGLDGLEAKG